MITIIADEGKNHIGTELQQGLLDEGANVVYISLENVEVKPCVNCRSCIYRTYGRCIIRDDGDWIYPQVIKSDVLVFITPITFGSYSFRIKRVFDKFGLIMDQHYFVGNNELVKGGMIGKQFKLFSVGVNENCINEEAEIFKKLFHENIVITRGTGKVYITGSTLSSETKNEIVKEVMRA